MDSAPTLQIVCQAIYSLYHNPDPVEKEKASNYLGELQGSVFAWKIADELLQHRGDLESCYFAAQTMRTKIQFSFHELPAESHSSLRDSLLNHISHVTNETSPVILTQLCLALSDLALQMATWKSPVNDLIARFGNSIQHVSTLLEILTVLPEEINSRHLRLGANRRNQVNENFCQVAPQVFLLLNSYVQSVGLNEPGVLKKVFRCLGSWFTIKGLLTDDQNLHVLLNYIFQVLVNHDSQSNVHNAASDALCSALVVVEDASSHQALATLLFQGVYTFVEAYNISVAREDTDKSVNYCRIFTELAESFLEEMVTSPNAGFGNLQTLDLLLICVGHHDFEVAEITFNVWYRLSEMLYKRNDDALNSIFEPYIQRLIVALCRHCQLDSDHEGVPEEGDDFSEFRRRVSDLIKDVVFIIGSSKCFQQMFENLCSQGNSATWDSSEASLFIMGAVAKNIVPDESRIVPRVVEAILNLPEASHVAVRYTSTYLLGELCDWIEKHPHYLDPTLNFLLSCLQKKPLSTVAATALQNICATCKKQMGSHFSGLLQIIQAIDTIYLSNDATVGLLRGTALILGQMPHDKITDGLMELCKTQTTPLSQLLKEDKSVVKEGTKTDPAVWLDRLAAIFRYTTPSITNGQMHPCLPVIEKVWPLLSETCGKYQADVRIIERCCRCIRFAVRCVGKQSVSLLQPLVTQMVQIYQVNQHSCFLYLGSVLVDEYGSEPGCIAGLLDMLQAFCTPAFRLLESNDGLRNCPDTVDDLFRLCTRFLQWAPVPFLQCPTIKPILQCAILATKLDHKDANTSVVKFFHDFIKGARLQEGSKQAQQDAASFHQRRALTQALLAEQGQNLVNTLMHSCVFCLPSYMLSNAADVFYDLVLYDKEALKIWLENALRLLPSQSSSGTVTATPEQLLEFHNNVLNAEHVKTVLNLIRDFARLYR
ncbi:transportin-3-like [Argiope bruennichi]|uniref:transportin-3-like n=1 Tax=Argiope bruennichi TaxID=94029 RepID=UPI0024941842|nr:transportin-3-like [Argiope bruennichi]